MPEESPMHADKGVEQIDRLIDVEMLSMEPLRISEFECAHRRYVLREPLVFDVEFCDNMWIYKNTSLKFITYVKNREDAIREISEDFHNLWSEIVEEDKNQLSADALKLRNHLVDMTTLEEKS